MHLLVAALAAVALSTPVARENAQPGTAQWSSLEAPSPAIEGYASAVSAAPGDRVDVHVSTAPAARYRIEVYRLGWYGGAGGRLLACIPSCTGDEQGVEQQQPGPPPQDPHSPPIRAGWPVTDSFTVGSDWVSGYYELRFVLTSGAEAGRANATWLIVRASGADRSRILAQVPVNTWQAYNDWGGKSLYDVGANERMYRVSFDRPYGPLAQGPLRWEIQAVRWLERDGYDVSYQTDLDTHRDPHSLLEHRLVLTLGHGEYWTSAMRSAFDAARDAGTNLAFLGSNTAYWQIRYEDGGRTIFGYKSLYDPNPDPSAKTALFREVGKPECQLMAVQHQWLPPHQVGSIDYTVAAPNDPWFAGTGFAAGDKVVDVVGHEWDVLNPFPESCVRPGLVDLFHFEGHPNLQNADAIRYTAPSGARVFASGAQQFAWGLDTWGTRTYGRTAPPDPRLQRFVRNALDDLGRPAPPPPVAARAHRRRVRVVVPASADPRVTGVRVYRDGVLVCSASPCRERRAPRGVHAYTATYVDRWGESAPSTAARVRVGR